MKVSSAVQDYFGSLIHGFRGLLSELVQTSGVLGFRVARLLGVRFEGSGSAHDFAFDGRFRVLIPFLEKFWFRVSGFRGLALGFFTHHAP